jgi:hypothetical protein
MSATLTERIMRTPALLFVAHPGLWPYLHDEAVPEAERLAELDRRMEEMAA